MANGIKWLTVSSVSFRVSNSENVDDWMTDIFLLADVGAAAHHQMISSYVFISSNNVKQMWN